ncbi:hypothetical protein Tco_0458088 [Tanacetum coccineum]
MAIFFISMSSDSSEESVGTSTTRVILFGKIPTAIPTTVPIVDPPIVHVDTPLIPTETLAIPPILSTLPHTSPFIYTDSSNSDTFERPPSQDPYERGSEFDRYHQAVLHRGHSLPDYSVHAPTTIPAGLSRKICRSLVVSVPLATFIPGALSLVRVDLLPPRKRISGTITTSNYDESTEESYEAYTKPDIDSDVQADINVDIVAAEATAAREADVGVKFSIRSDGEDEAETRNRGTIKIGVNKVSEVKSAQIEQGRRMLAFIEQRAVMLNRIEVLERDNMRLREMLCVERERVNNLRCHMSYTQEELRQIRVSRYYDQAEFRRLKTFAIRRLGYRP